MPTPLAAAYKFRPKWEDLLDIDDSDLSLTPVLRPCNRHVRVDDSVLSTQEYMKQVIEDVGEDEDFNSGSWVGATEYVKANGGIVSRCLRDIKTFLKNGKLEQVVAIIKSCSPNALGDLKVTVKDLSGSAIILANVSVFSPNLLMHYLNITKKNVVKVFHKDFVPGNGSGVGGSGMLMEEEEIMKLVEEEEIADLELHVCGNAIDQGDLYKFDEEALDLVLKEEARESRAHEEWLEKGRQQEKEDAKHERQFLGFHETI
ncbi:reverse transcriptase zinc-binding domain-containing protein [Tanacetum coccineum]